MADETPLNTREKGTLTVGLEGTYPPFSFVDESGKLSGFEVDFAQALAKKLGIQAKLQTTKWDGLLAALESKRLDVVINQVTISDERRKKYDFSTPYTVSGIQALTRSADHLTINTPADLANKKVGVGLGSNYEQWVRATVPAAIVKTYEDDPTKMQDLRVGRIDAALVDRLAALEMVKKTHGELAANGEPFSRLESGIALRKDEPQLLAAIDKAIAQLRDDGTLAQLSQKWFGADVTQ
ncbi:cystine ABC transporter substrate-binding protein [Pseudomonas typographi]